MICTPKVRQTLGGAYFYGKKGTNIQKILARVQIICYTRYARTQVELSRNNAKIFSAFGWFKNFSFLLKWERKYLEEGIEGLSKENRGRPTVNGKKRGRPPKLDKQVEEDLIAENQRLRMEIEYLKKLSALVLAEEQKNGKRPK